MRRNRTLARLVLAATATVTAALATFSLTGTAEAATGVWYGVPAAQGATGSAIMTTFTKGYASGYAAGRIYLRNTGGQRVYVQFKPNEGGTWNRGTPNQTSGAAYYNWSDSFTMNYSGFQFRICKDNSLVGDTCGVPVKIYG